MDHPKIERPLQTADKRGMIEGRAFQAKGSIVTIAVASLLPSALSVALAFASFGASTDDLLTRFFFWGGHAIVLGFVWSCFCVYVRSEHPGAGGAAVCMAIAVVSLLAVIVSWSLVAFSLFLRAIPWP